jgi:hypothetical protein
LFYADGQTDRHDDVNSRFTQFGESAQKGTEVRIEKLRTEKEKQRNETMEYKSQARRRRRKEEEQKKRNGNTQSVFKRIRSSSG